MKCECPIERMCVRFEWRMNNVDDSAQRIGAVEHAVRSTDNLDAFSIHHIYFGTLRLVPCLAFESYAVRKNENSCAGKTANHGLDSKRTSCPSFGRTPALPFLLLPPLMIRPERLLSIVLNGTL